MFHAVVGSLRMYVVCIDVVRENVHTTWMCVEWLDPHPGTAMGYTRLDEGCDPGAPEGVLLYRGGLPGCVTHRVTYPSREVVTPLPSPQPYRWVREGHSGTVGTALR